MKKISIEYKPIIYNLYHQKLMLLQAAAKKAGCKTYELITGAMNVNQKKSEGKILFSTDLKYCFQPI